MVAVEEQVKEVVELIRPAVQADGGDIILVGVDEDDGVVNLQLVGACLSYSH